MGERAGEGVAECVWCDRECPRCRYPITGGFEHVEQPQPPGASHVVCSLKRVQRPLVEAISIYLDHQRDHTEVVTVRQQRSPRDA